MLDKQIKNNLIRVLEKAINAIKKQDYKELKQVSDETIHDATIYQEEHSISLAVLIYSLSKIHEREFHYSQFRGWTGFCDNCFKGLEQAKQKLLEDNEEEFDKILKNNIFNLIKVDEKLKKYVQDVLQSAKINKASRLYEHGISMGRTADLLGISRFELMDYIGKTYISDVKTNNTIDALTRLKFARGLFK